MVVSGSALLEVVVDLSRLSFSAVLCCAVLLFCCPLSVMSCAPASLTFLPCRGSVRLFDFLLDQIILRQMGAHRGNENLYPPSIFFLTDDRLLHTFIHSTNDQRNEGIQSMCNKLVTCNQLYLQATSRLN